jgi:NTP pyrophosphatase (non-canonical NTP hydrolase)
MDFNEYQKLARSTAIYPGVDTSFGCNYPIVKLNGEAGEVAEKWGKVLRDHNGIMSPEHKQAIAYELGDVLWYVANTAKELGYTLDTIAKMNVDKVLSRKDRDVIQGSGDDR